VIELASLPKSFSSIICQVGAWPLLLTMGATKYGFGAPFSGC